jgi:hypothetical protein
MQPFLISINTFEKSDIKVEQQPLLPGLTQRPHRIESTMQDSFQSDALEALKLRLGKSSPVLDKAKPDSLTSFRH